MRWAGGGVFRPVFWVCVWVGGGGGVGFVGGDELNPDTVGLLLAVYLFFGEDFQHDNAFLVHIAIVEGVAAAHQGTALVTEEFSGFEIGFSFCHCIVILSVIDG